MPDYPQNTTSSRPQGRGGRNNRRRRSGGPNSNAGSGAPRDRQPPRPAKQVPASGFQKFLHKVTFGILGKPAEKPSTSASSYRAEPQRTPRTDRVEQRQERRGPGNENRPPREARPPRQSQHTSAEVTNEKLYVGNLSYDASESDLFELFKGSGRVKNAEVVVNNRTQRSKGFAFVTMMSVDEAKKAVAELNAKDFMGRPLIVGGAKPMQERDDRPARQDAHVSEDDIIRPPADDEEEETH